MTNSPVEYLYAILDSWGQCWRVADGEAQTVPGMPYLLGEGWRPVREVSFGDGGHVLILLERDTRDPKGLGFQPWGKDV